MARKLKSDEAQIFDGTANPNCVSSEAEALLRSLADKENNPLELTFPPELWLKGSPPDSFGS